MIRGREPWAELRPRRYERIANTRKGTRNMPAYASQISSAECDHVSAFASQLVSVTEGEHVARCPECGTEGPPREGADAARRALTDLGLGEQTSVKLREE